MKDKATDNILRLNFGGDIFVAYALFHSLLDSYFSFLSDAKNGDQLAKSGCRDIADLIQQFTAQFPDVAKDSVAIREKAQQVEYRRILRKVVKRTPVLNKI
jgi:hypothetical protein